MMVPLIIGNQAHQVAPQDNVSRFLCLCPKEGFLHSTIAINLDRLLCFLVLEPCERRRLQMGVRALDNRHMIGSYLNSVYLCVEDT